MCHLPASSRSPTHSVIALECPQQMIQLLLGDRMDSETKIDFASRIVLASEAQDLLFREARTPNSFTEEPVDDEHLEAVYDLFQFAPTSMNQQPLRILVVRSDAARARLLPLMRERNRAKTAAAPLIVVLAADLNFHEQLHKVFPHVPNARDVYADRVPREDSARFNATLQIGYFIL